jgi:hypothetical protein
MKMYHLVEAESLWALSQRGAVNLPQVKELQDRLRAAGHDLGASDGWYGQKTANAVRAYQEANGLKVDGDAGPQTLAKLGMASAQQTKAVATSPEKTAAKPAPRKTSTEPKNNKTNSQPARRSDQSMDDYMKQVGATRPATSDELDSSNTYTNKWTKIAKEQKVFEKKYTNWFNNYKTTLKNGKNFNAFVVVGRVNVYGDEESSDIYVPLTIDPNKLKKITNDKKMIAFWTALWNDDEESALKALEAGSGEKLSSLNSLAVTAGTSQVFNPVLRRMWREFIEENDIEPETKISMTLKTRYNQNLQFGHYSKRYYG